VQSLKGFSCIICELVVILYPATTSPPMLMLPYQRFTFVSGLSAEELTTQLQQHIHPQGEPKNYQMTAELLYLHIQPLDNYTFDGWAKGYQFKIWQKIHYPEYLLPIIRGKIEPTSMGSIVFVRFSFARGTLFIMFLALFVLCSLALVFLLLEKNFVNFLFILAFLIGGYMVMMLNFYQKVKIAKQLLEKVLAGNMENNL
jgi:hypothetical protein